MGVAAGHGAWTFEFDRREDGDRFKLDELREAEAQLLGSGKRLSPFGDGDPWVAVDPPGAATTTSFATLPVDDQRQTGPLA